ncbi:hypothetical protein JHK82_050074 [Glycine max]|nr:hypothetical protein JHK82_050074 [Glycine max]
MDKDHKSLLDRKAEGRAAAIKEKSTKFALEDILQTAPSTDIVVSELTHVSAEVSEIVFFLLGAMTIVEIVDTHRGFKLVTDNITTKNPRLPPWVDIGRCCCNSSKYWWCMESYWCCYHYYAVDKWPSICSANNEGLLENSLPVSYICLDHVKSLCGTT